MMKKLNSLLLLLMLSLPMMAQDQNFGIRFNGFVKTDVIYDSRQTVALREGHFLLWPAAQNLDANGKDINGAPNFNIMSLQTRLTGNITAPDALGAKVTGMIEGEFFGTSEGDINGFRLRHAYGKLRWEKSELLFGQTWHPMFITSCFPDVVSFNTGAPFQPFARNPQVRFTWFAGNFSAAATALVQRDFTSHGGSMVLRSTGLPEFNLNLMYHKKGDGGHEWLTGFSTGYKTIRPRLVSNANELATETVSSMITEAYFKIRIPALTFKLEGVLGQNSHDIMGISSYALIHNHPITNQQDYAPLTSMSVWSEIQSNGTKFQVGLFGGYTKNLGTIGNEEVHGTMFGSRSNIDYIYRVAPRLVFNSGKMRFAGELEYTAAAYGDFNSQGAVSNSVEVGNLRVLVAAFLFF